MNDTGTICPCMYSYVDESSEIAEKRAGSNPTSGPKECLHVASFRGSSPKQVLSLT